MAKVEEKIKVKVNWMDGNMKGKIPLNYNANDMKLLIPDKEYELTKGEIESLEQARNLEPSTQILDDPRDIRGRNPEDTGPEAFTFSKRGRVNVIYVDKADKRVTNENDRLRNENEALRKRLEAAESKGAKDEVSNKRGNNTEGSV